MARVKRRPGERFVPWSAPPNHRPSDRTPTLPPNLAGKSAKKSNHRRYRLDPWYPKRKSLPPPAHYTCRICISYLPSESFIRWVPPIRYIGYPLDVPRHCVPHLARNPSLRNDPVCKNCVGAYMAAQLDTLGAQAVGRGCMEPGCDNPWPFEMVIEYLPTPRLEEYNLAMFEHWRTKANLLKCFEPACGFVALIENWTLGYPKLECPSPTCRARSCALCLTPWHDGQSCAEISATRVTAQVSDEEKETLALLQVQGAKRCPNPTCQFVVEKLGGCPTMLCGACGRYFQWDEAASVTGERRPMPPAGHGFDYVPPQGACEVDGPQRVAHQVPVCQEALDLYQRLMPDSGCHAPLLDSEDDDDL